MKKRVLAMVMALCLVMSFAVSMAFASGDKSGSCGNGVTWTLDASGKLTIRGSGAMADYKEGDPRAPWYSYKDQIKSASVESGVTKIGNYAFHSCGNMTSVSIADTVTEIGEYAFQDCYKLSAISVAAGNKNFVSVDGVLYNKDQTRLLRYPPAKTAAFFRVPSTVTSFKECAFEDAAALTEIMIPNSVTDIAQRAFVRCSGLTAVALPKYLPSINIYIFGECSKLKAVTIPETICAISSSAFSGCPALQAVYYAGTEAQWKEIELSKDNKAFTSKVQFNRPTYTATFVNSPQRTVYPVEVLNGTTVSWTADNTGTSRVFKEWRGLSAVTLVEGSAASKTVKFTMPAKNVTLFMTYAPAPTPTGKA